MSRGTMMRNERKRLKLSQQDVADAAKISQQTYSDIENDIIVSPRRPILRAIAKMLEIPFESLLLGNDWRCETPMSEADRVISREIPHLSPEARSKIVVVILEDKQNREVLTTQQEQKQLEKAV